MTKFEDGWGRGTKDHLGLMGDSSEWKRCAGGTRRGPSGRQHYLGGKVHFAPKEKKKKKDDAHLKESETSLSRSTAFIILPFVILVCCKAFSSITAI